MNTTTLYEGELGSERMSEAVPGGAVDIAELDDGFATVGEPTLEDGQARMQTRGVGVHYSGKQAIFDVNLDIGRNQVIAMIGPSGCGKSTFLRCLNRMNDTIEGCVVSGEITLDDQNIYDPGMDVVPLRARVGMVFQKPNPFPKSIYDNVAYGPRIHGLVRDRTETDEVVQRSLEKAGLCSEVKDRLDQPGTGLSGGQQQRLCIARASASATRAASCVGSAPKPPIVALRPRSGRSNAHAISCESPMRRSTRWRES